MKKILIALLVCAGAMFTSCALDEYNPAGENENKISDNYASFHTSQAYCYNPMYGQLYTKFDFLSMAEGGADLWFNSYKNDYAPEVFYYEGLVPFSNKGWDKAFTQMYAALAACNTIISVADDVKAKSSGHDDDIDILVAETRFLRGFYHLLLTTYYGPITLIMTPPSGDSSDNSFTRNSLSEIYKAITDDLKAAADILGDTPFGGNRARATRPAALGILARAYAQGAGQGLSEGGKSYWTLARETAEMVINEYPDRWYDDVADTWADYNNKNNKEALFIAAGPSTTKIPSKGDFQSYANGNICNLHKYSFPKQNSLGAKMEINGKSPTWALDGNNYGYGRSNEPHMAPSKYLVDVFDASWDKRWEYTFVTAWSGWSFVDWSYPKYNDAVIEITESICDTYGIDKKHIGKKIYPYYDVRTKPSIENTYQNAIWPYGVTDGDTSQRLELETGFKKAFAIDPTIIDENENRFYMYISKEGLTDAEKAERPYAVVNMDELFTSDFRDYKQETGDPKSSAFPGFIKFNWSYYDASNSDSSLQYKNGDILVLRMAEMYLIAAEAYAMEGNAGKAAEMLNPLRQRAVRNPAETAESVWKLSSADMDTVLDEYAREMCGEFSRWAILQRHYNDGAFEKLKTRNPRAYDSFRSYHKWRPISLDFLQLIDNPEEYGDNGYGITANSGLTGFEE